MRTDPTKTPAQLADEAMNTARDAADSASNFAQASKGVAHDAVRALKVSGDDAMALGRDAGTAVGAYAEEARATGTDALATARAYAKDAARAANARLDGVKDQLQTAKQRSTRYIADEPVRASLIAAAGGALLTALLVSFIRGDRRER